MEAKVTIPALQQMKRDGRKSIGVVAWDYQIARIAERAMPIRSKSRWRRCWCAARRCAAASSARW